MNYIDEAGSGVNGAWGAWSEWTTCPVTCGGDTQMRTRLCDNPPPQLGAKNCTADGSSTTDIRRCNEDPCPSTCGDVLIDNDDINNDPFRAFFVDDYQDRKRMQLFNLFKEFLN